MGTLHPSLIGRHVAAFLLLLLPALARGEETRTPTQRPALETRDAHVDRLIATGHEVDAFSEGVKILRERLALSGPRSPETAGALRRIAVALRGISDIELVEATWHLTRLVASESLGPCHPLVAEAIAACTWYVRRMYPADVDIAAPFTEALSMLDPGVPEQRSVIGRIQADIGYSYFRRDLPRTVDMLEEAVLTLEGASDVSLCIATRAWLGWTLLQMGRHDESRFQLESARHDAQRSNIQVPPILALIEGTLADLDALSGDWSSAENGYRRAAALNGRERRTGSTRVSEVALEGYPSIALAELKSGRTDEAWQSLQYYRGLLNKRLRSLSQFADRSPGSYARVQALRDRVDANRDLRRRWHRPQTFGDINWTRVLDELEANAELFRLEAAYFAPKVLQTATLAELQSQLPNNYAYIGWLNCRIGDGLLVSKGPILDSCWMYVVRAQGPVRWIPIWENTTNAAQGTLRRPASDYGHTMERAAAWTLRVNDDPLLARLARVLANQEFNAALPFLDGVDHLIVEFFEDRVAWKPIEALILPDGTYVGDRFAVAYSPTADAFVAHRKSLPVTRDKVLVVGDPIFNPNAVAARSTVAESSNKISGHASAYDRALHRAATNGDPAALQALPRLPYAGLEIDHLRKVFPESVTLRGNDATEANVRRIVQSPEGSEFRIVHFATHALTETPLGHRHALALARLGVSGSPDNDGVVDGLEIQLGWDLSADLVTLSGCETLTGWAWYRGEPTGLASVMLGAGARSVLATFWQVDDLAAARLNARFYENLTGRYEGAADGRDGKPMDKAVALAEAKRWLRNYQDDSGRKPFAHPVYWSGFLLIGDPD